MILMKSVCQFRICFKLRVMILAVEMKHTDENGNTRLVVEVAPKNDCIIQHGTRAFMVCSSSEDAKRYCSFISLSIDRMLLNRVKYYCAICHPNVDQLTQTQLKRMRKCRHGKTLRLR